MARPRKRLRRLLHARAIAAALAYAAWGAVLASPAAHADGCAPGEDDFYGTCVERLSVFGQASWKETAVGAVRGHTIGNHAAGVAIDRSVKPNRIWVADTSNNRILGFRSLGQCSLAPAIPCTNDSDCAGASAGTCAISGAFGQPFNPTFRDADVVIGQPDLGSSACNGDDNVGIYGPASASTLCLMQTPAVDNVAESWQSMNFDVDSRGDLWVTDRHNNRVLEYLEPFSDDRADGKGDAVADVVIGQPDFSSDLANRGGDVGADTLFLNEGAFQHVAVPSFGGVSVGADDAVWIADFGNSRVLRYPAGSATPDLVLGQATFTTADPGALVAPFAVAHDPDGGQLYVLDHDWSTNSDRIVVFEPDRRTGAFTSGMAPRRTIVPRHGLTYPKGWSYVFRASGMTLNRHRKGKYARGKIWVYEGPPGQRAALLDAHGHFVRVIGAPSASAIGGAGWSDGHPECTSASYSYRLHWPAGSGAIDDDGNLYVADEGFSRIAVYHLPTYSNLFESRTRCPPPPNAVLLGSDELARDRLLAMYGGAHAVGGQLFAGDWTRVVVWSDYAAKPIGAPADFAIDGADTAGGRGAAVDDQGHLWLGTVVLALPVTADAPAPLARDVPVYWGDDPSTQVTTIAVPAWDPVGRKLWIADGNRVLRIANAGRVGTGEKLLVDLVVGQVAKGANDCNQGFSSPAASRLCVASEVQFDPSGNLYVVENAYECHGNNRITVFTAADIAAAQGLFPNLSARIAFGGTLTTRGDCAFSPVAVAFDSRGRMVVANDGGTSTSDYRTRAVRQLFFYPTPLADQTPSATIRVPMGAPGAIQFDEQDDLVIRDGTWHRIWVVNLDRDPSWLVSE